MATTKATLLGHRSATSFSDLTLSGDLTVNGTTTTLDTAVQNVDKLEIGASSTDYGAKINQASTGNILQLQDGGTDVMVVKDGGNVGIGDDAPASLLGLKGSSASATLGTAPGINLYNSGTTGEGHGSHIWFSHEKTAGKDNSAAIYGLRGAGELDGDLQFAVRDNGSWVTAMHIDGADGGNVGIGTDNPSKLLTVQGAGNSAVIQINSTGTSNGLIHFADDGTTKAQIQEFAGNLYLDTTNNIYFRPNNWGATVMRISSSEKVGIGGDTDSQSVLKINDANPNYGMLLIRDTSGASNQVYIRFQYGGSATSNGGIRRQGTSQNLEFFGGSDRRIKKDIVPMDETLSKICQVELKKYNYKNDENASGIGPIAQDLVNIFPNKVVKTDNGLGDTLPEGVEPWTIGLNFTFELMKAIQELSAKVTALENATN